MTNKELNRDIRRLVRNFNKGGAYTPTGDHCPKFTEEFKRLYYADPDLTAITPVNLLAMMRINLTLRIIGLHLFAIQYNISNL